MIRRLDHVAVAVRSTDAALAHFRDQLGLRVAATDEPPGTGVRLTYLDAGNAWLQLVEPLDPSSPVTVWLDEHGDGLHHVCFGVDDVAADLTRLASAGQPVGSGRGRPAAFLGGLLAGVRVELTAFDRLADVDGRPAFLGR